MDGIKRQVIAEVINITRSMLATAEEGRRNAIEESKYHKGAMQSRYDTFKEEAQYLMQAQDVRIAEFNSTISTLSSLLTKLNGETYTKVGLLTLVELKNESGKLVSYLILPAGGGITCTVNKKKVTTINESSPLALAINGLSQSEEAEFIAGASKKILSVVSIS